MTDESQGFRDWRIAPRREGAKAYAKVSYPIRYGSYGEIETTGQIYQFNLNGELKFLRGKGPDWPSPSEWLKRTAGDDWVYYSAGDYREVFDATGEFYLPCPSYPSNAIPGTDPFRLDAVRSAIASWQDLSDRLRDLPASRIVPRDKAFLELVAGQGPDSLRRRAERLHEILGCPVPVLPPDTRHVDYDVVPIVIADGCLYNCGFCAVKSGGRLTHRSSADIAGQIEGLRGWYGRDLANYNSIFLGTHDALHAGGEAIELAARKAYEAFSFADSNMSEPGLFLFASVGSFLAAGEALLRSLDRLPFRTFLNIGLESADQETLDRLGKPIRAEEVGIAFRRMVEVNRRHENIEVTANFVFGESLPETHLPALVRMSRETLPRAYGKGAVYLSPLIGGSGDTPGARRDTIRTFRDLKTRLPIPAFLYVIQRL